MLWPRSQRPTERPCGLTLVEIVVSTLIVGAMTVAALNALGAATRSGASAANRAIAFGLADDLMAEILEQAYSDPDGSPQFGPETGESTGSRAAFDDVDDYDSLTESPPKARDGTPFADRDVWRRVVDVRHVVPDNPRQATTGNADQGAKRIHVKVKLGSVVLAEQFAVVTDTQ